MVVSGYDARGQNAAVLEQFFDHLLAQIDVDVPSGSTWDVREAGCCPAEFRAGG